MSRSSLRGASCVRRSPGVSRALLIAILLAALIAPGVSAGTRVRGASGVRADPAGVSRTRRVPQSLSSSPLAFGAPIETAGSFVEMKMRITAKAAATASATSTSNRWSVSAEGGRLRRGRLPLLRSIQPSEMQLLVVGTDSANHARFVSAIANPLLIRAESPGVDGQLHGTVIELPSAEMFLRVPADPAITKIRIYRPVFGAGGKATFRLLGAFPSEGSS